MIKTERLGKKYIIGHQLRTNRRSIRDTIDNALRNFAKRVKHPLSIGSSSIELEEFWALRDVNIVVSQGDRLGIIGPNGAGKSTLLKLLSRVTTPTEGRILINGRVSSLLEVGTGFHPELTGRENIFLNGAILGMSRNEIKRKFDEIVAFAEIDRFLDTPIKRYSSGMYVRLAFAVAAHLEPEILIVDEVLAVGDLRFQKKCLGKMESTTSEGRTLLFVSHNLQSIANLCTRAIWLSEGRIAKEGNVDEVISAYVDNTRKNTGERSWEKKEDAPGNDKIRLKSVRIVSGGEISSDIDIQNDIIIEVEFWNNEPGALITTFIHILDHMNSYVMASANLPSINISDDGWYNRPHPKGLFRSQCIIPGSLLNVGTYSLNVSVQTDIKNPQAVAREVITFNIHDMYGYCKEYSGKVPGVVRPRLAWSTRHISDEIIP